MQMKKKLAMVAIAAAVLFVGATSPVSASPICEMEATSFEVWFIQQFYC